MAEFAKITDAAVFTENHGSGHKDSSMPLNSQKTSDAAGSAETIHAANLQIPPYQLDTLRPTKLGTTRPHLMTHSNIYSSGSTKQSDIA